MSKKSESGSVASTARGSDEFIVERILDRRFSRGKFEYLLKWQGYTEADNSWEPSENISPYLVEEFNKDYEAKRRSEKTEKKKEKKLKYEAKMEAKEKTKEQAGKNERKRVRKIFSSASDEPTRQFGFDRGLEAETIIGATEEDGKLMFLIKWKNNFDAEVVPSAIARVKCPQVVIRFYEQMVQWNNIMPEEPDETEN